MSKQYLAAHTADLENSHADVFSLAASPTHLLVASGLSALDVLDPTSDGFPAAQKLTDAHPLGAHHIAASGDGRTAVSVGFGGHIRLWSLDSDSSWTPLGNITDGVNRKACEIWAVSVDQDGRYVAGTTADGRCLVWDLQGGGADSEQASKSPTKIREFETSSSKGNFGLCVDMSPDGTLTATGHVSGSVYIFANGTGRLSHAFPSLNAPVRSIKFSPGGRLVAIAGDNCTIVLHDPHQSTPVAQLRGHTSWVLALSFSPTGERLASTDWSGRIKVWDIGRRECVWTGRVDEGGPLWSVQWLRETRAGVFGALGRCEGFAVGGAKGLVRVFREAAGG